MLSSSVAKALELFGGEAALETARFASMFDKLFDCLNVSCFTAGKRARNCFKSPYRAPTDFRVKVILCACTCSCVRMYVYIYIYICQAITNRTLFSKIFLFYTRSGFKKNSSPI